MSDLTNDRSTELQEGLFEDLPVAAGQKIYAGAAVGKASTGYAGGADASTYTDFRGRAESQVDNTDGSSGDLTVRVRRGPVLKWDGSGLSDPSDVGAEVYFSDDHTVTKTPTDCFAGVILEVVSTTSCFVDHRPALFSTEGGPLISPNIVTAIQDENGNEALKLTATESAVNELTLANAATGAEPSLAPSGDDTNVGMDLKTKGTGVGSLVGDDTDVLQWQKDTAAKLAFFDAALAAQASHVADASQTSVYPTADADAVTAVDPTADADAVTAVEPTADADAVTAVDPTLDASDITDNSGGVDPADHTIPAFSNTDALTDSTGGSADDTLDAVTQQAGGAGVELTDGDATKINNNFKEVADQLATQKTFNTAAMAAVALITAEYNSLKDDTEANETTIEQLVDDVTSIRAAVVANNATAEAVVDDVTSIRAAVAANNVTAEALVDDVTSIRAAVVANNTTTEALVDDVAALVSKLNSILSTLETFGFHATS